MPLLLSHRPDPRSRLFRAAVALLVVLPILIPPEVSGESGLDSELRALVKSRGADAPLAPGFVRKTPAEDPVIKLGEILFFSKTLGGTFDSACASCHHPELAGGDGLSLAVGVAAKDPDFLGLGREVEPSLDNDPLRDGGPNVPRNSQTIINSSLYQRELFFDGRVERLRYAPDDGPPQFTTPDSNNLADRFAGSSMLQAQARFPVTSADEMRNFLHPELNSTWAFRNHLVKRLRGEADREFLSREGPENWRALFRAAFGSKVRKNDLITYENIQRAIAAYEESVVFVDFPFRRFIDGESDAISAEAKEGALLFYRDRNQGGLECYGCHSGNFFSDERFHNTGIPQIGRGKRADDNDFGRWQVTKQESDTYAFRTAGLINIALTGPFGHTGTFDTLEEFLRYHADPKREVERFDFALQHLAQFKGKVPEYPNAKRYTLNALAAPNFAPSLPERALTSQELIALTAFLRSLSSDCLSRSMKECLAPWTPTAEEDPDGNLLVRASAPSSDSQRFARSAQSALKSAPYPHQNVVLGKLSAPSRAVARCAGKVEIGGPSNDGGTFFVERTKELGLTNLPGFSSRGAPLDTAESSTDYQQLLPAGGVSAGYTGDDCRPDLYYTAGNRSGAYLLRNDEGRGFSPPVPLLPPREMKSAFTGIGVGDLNGDGIEEIVLGNLRAGDVEILGADTKWHYQEIAKLPMERNTYGIAFGDFNHDTFPDLYLGHWDYNGLPGTAPALWRNNGGGALSPADKAARLSVDFGINQNWQFTPSFADIDGDGRSDLLLASDFLSSTVLRDVGDGKFLNVTDRAVITDENGMGSALGDFRNSGKLDWFVTAVFDPTGRARGNWGVRGNRMYRNESTPGEIRFKDVTDEAKVRDGLWGWGACAADFDNDGWLDILQVNGYGAIPPGIKISKENGSAIESLNRKLTQFATKSSRLFMNKRDGSFEERAAAWRIDAPMDGRGLVCFDYDRDGDVDAAILDRSSGVRIFENRLSDSGTGSMISIRLVGRSPNTAALGAKVYLTADLDGNGEIGETETQLRISAANSNFNSQNPPDLQFGLGKAGAAARVRIVWPSGEVRESRNITGNRFLVVEE